MSKLWTVNIQINTIYFNRKSSWEKPFRNDREWQENINMTAASNSPDDQIISGNIGDFNLVVSPGDTIQWLISEVNPIHSNKTNVCMYGLIAGKHWKNNLSDITILHKDLIFPSIEHYFNSPENPDASFISLDNVNTSIPFAQVITDKFIEKVSYHINIALVNTNDIIKPEIFDYIQLDSSLLITPSL